MKLQQCRSLDAHLASVQLAPDPSHTSTLCCPPSSSKALSTVSYSVRFSVTEGSPVLLLLLGVVPGVLAAGVVAGGGPPMYLTTASVR